MRECYFELTYVSFIWSSQVMNVEFMHLTLKLCSNNPKCKSLSSLQPKKACKVKSNIKSLLMFHQHWWNYPTLVPGHTINREFYRIVVKEEWDSTVHKSGYKWHKNERVLHLVNVRSYCFHNAAVVTKNNMAVVPHPPYLPGLDPCNFFLFPKMKIRLNRQRLYATEKIQTEMETVLKTHKKKTSEWILIVPEMLVVNKIQVWHDCIQLHFTNFR